MHKKRLGARGEAQFVEKQKQKGSLEVEEKSGEITVEHGKECPDERSGYSHGALTEYSAKLGGQHAAS